MSAARRQVEPTRWLGDQVGASTGGRWLCLVNIAQQLIEFGVSVWLDGLDRHQLADGEIERLIRNQSVSGVTTGPATLQSAILNVPDAYAAQLADAHARGLDVVSTLKLLATTDLQQACDELLPVFNATRCLDGYASIQVDPRFVNDADATIVEARNLRWLVDRPNLLIKIPATNEGLAAITTCLAEGISVNAGLIYGVRRYAQVIDAYMDALERRRARGLDVSAVTSVASFLVSRFGAAVASKAPQLRTLEGLQLRVTLANARLAHRLFLRSLQLPRWSVLAAAGARPQRLLWASAFPEDPALPNTVYVAGLAIPGAIVEMAAPTLATIARPGTLSREWREDDDSDALDVLRGLAAAGVDHDDLVAALEGEDLSGHTTAWQRAVAAVATAQVGRQ